MQEHSILTAYSRDSETESMYRLVGNALSVTYAQVEKTEPDDEVTQRGQ